METGWCVEQTWRHLVMAHWQADAATLRRRVPRALEIDTWEGRAYVSVVAFSVDPFRLRGMPPIPGMKRFWQLNVRTYVRHQGAPGVYFFRLDANHALLARLGRVAFAIPYEPAEIAVVEEENRVAVAMEARGSRPGRMVAGWTRAGSRMPWYEPQPGSLEHWLLNRFTLFTNVWGCIARSDLAHAPWVVQPAQVKVRHAEALETYGCGPQPVLALAAEARTARIGPLRPA